MNCIQKSFYNSKFSLVALPLLLLLSSCKADIIVHNDQNKVYDATAAPTLATRLRFISQPPHVAVAGLSFAQPSIVQVQDINGNVNLEAGGTANLTAYIDPTCTVVASGVLTSSPVNLVDGVAAFTGVNYTRAETIYLKAIAGGFESACSTGVVVKSGAATGLGYHAQPTSGTIGVALKSIIVKLQDAYGNIDTTANDTVTLSFGNNPSGAVLSGTLTRATSNGIATFDNIILDQLGTNYVFVVRGSSYSNTAGMSSQNFNVIAEVASQMLMSGPQSGGTNSCVGPYSLGLRSAQGNAVTAINALSIPIDANGASALAELYLDMGCTISANTAVISSGQASSSYFYLKNSAASTEVVTLSADGDGNNLGTAELEIKTVACPMGYIHVPGNAAYSVAQAVESGGVLTGGQGFCVMKYEAKGSSPAVSTASGLPRVLVSRNSATTLCSLNGLNYHLITNAEWMVIARSIEINPLNWNSSFSAVTATNSLGNPAGVVGTGMISRGFDSGAASSELEAGLDTDPTVGTGGAFWARKRTHTLSNGSIIWDLAGNVDEWVSDNFSSYTGMQYSILTDPTTRFLFAPNASNYGTTQGVGIFLGGTAGSARRGGNRADSSHSGIFTARLDLGPTGGGSASGFRCTFAIP